jgi:carbon storage regulator
MLILRRKAGESLLIGDNIKITVISTEDGGVRLAIDAPKEITVLREELVSAMRVNQDAAHAAAPNVLLEAIGQLPHPGSGQKK